MRRRHGIELEPPVPLPVAIRSVSPCTMRTRSGGSAKMIGDDLRIGRVVALPGRSGCRHARGRCRPFQATASRCRGRWRRRPRYRSQCRCRAASPCSACRVGARFEAVPVGELQRARHLAVEFAGVVDLAGRGRVRHLLGPDEILAPQAHRARRRSRARRHRPAARSHRTLPAVRRRDRHRPARCWCRPRARG